MSSTIKNVLCKTCLILIIGFTFLTASYAHAQQQTVVLRVDGDNGSLPPPQGTADGSDWGTTAFRLLQDALAEAEEILVEPDTTVHLWVAGTIPANPYVPDRDAVNPGGTGDRDSTFLLDFNNVTLLGGFLGDETDPDDRDPAMYETVLSGFLEPRCGTTGTGSCFLPNGTPFCDNAACCEAVCAIDPNCCDVTWDQVCADLALDVCGSCGDPAAGYCFEDNGTPGCDDADCCATVCEADPLCCEIIWDQLCADLAFTVCGPCGDPVAGDCFLPNGTPGCDGATCCVAVCTVVPDCCEVAWDEFCVNLAFAVCGPCGTPGAGDCFVANNTPGCDDTACCEVVCTVDPDCCEVAWDQDCVDFANVVCEHCGEPGSGSCFEDTGSPGCEDGSCCALVCNVSPECCTFEWDGFCADFAELVCDFDPPPPPAVPVNAYHVVTADGVDDTVRIDGFTITEGLADAGSDFLGAGMEILDASPAVVRIIFTANAAPSHGGGAMHIGGASDPLVVNCEFIANTGQEAGALHTEGGGAGGTFVNCLFSENTSMNQGGAINPGADGDLNFINCTFVDNTVADPDGGGAIFTESTGSGDVILINCILWGNEAGGDPNQIEDSEGEVTVSYSDVEGEIDPGWDGGNNITDDPLFVDPGNGDYRLDALSPCIDFGNPNETVIPMDEFDVNQDGDTGERTPDLDLNDRLINKAGSCSEGRVDMGAYEAPACCPHDMDDNGSVGATDLLTLLVQWGTDPGGPPDFDCSGIVGATDLLSLLVNWGPCECGVSTSGLTLAEELADACLTQEDWDEFVDVMTDPLSSEEDKDRYNCWMTHHLFHCDDCSCTHLPECPSPDPFN